VLAGSGDALLHGGIARPSVLAGTPRNTPLASASFQPVLTLASRVLDAALRCTAHWETPITDCLLERTLRVPSPLRFPARNDREQRTRALDETDYPAILYSENVDAAC
jgi:hypothetical protein